MSDGAPVGRRHRLGFVIRDIGNTRRRTRGGAVTDYVNDVEGLKPAEEILEADERKDGVGHSICMQNHSLVIFCTGKCDPFSGSAAIQYMSIS